MNQVNLVRSDGMNEDARKGNNSSRCHESPSQVCRRVRGPRVLSGERPGETGVLEPLFPLSQRVAAGEHLRWPRRGLDHFEAGPPSTLT